MQSHRLKFNADFSVFYVAIVAFSVIFSIFMRIVPHASTHEFLLYIWTNLAENIVCGLGFVDSYPFEHHKGVLVEPAIDVDAL